MSKEMMSLRDLALIAFILGAAVPAARGHGNMVWPPVWQVTAQIVKLPISVTMSAKSYHQLKHFIEDKNQIKAILQDKNATFGLEKYSILKIGGDLNFFGDPEKTGNILMWYSNIVYIPDDIEPSLPVSLTRVTKCHHNFLTCISRPSSIHTYLTTIS